MTHTIHIPQEDYAILNLLASATSSIGNAGKQRVQALRSELDRAAVLPREQLPSDVAVLGSSVTFMDLETDEKEQYTLALPQHADIEHRRLSVLSPIGTALLGYREGDIVEWPTPGGVRRLQILRVTHPPKDGAN